MFEHEPFTVAGIKVTPIPVVHGNMRVAGFRIGDAAYITDTNLVPPSSIDLLKGVKLLVLDALRRTPHPTHMSLPQATEVAREAAARVFTHINHDIEHESINKTLPEFARLGYDMLRASVEEDGSVKVHDRTQQLHRSSLRDDPGLRDGGFEKSRVGKCPVTEETGVCRCDLSISPTLHRSDPSKALAYI